MLGSLAGSPAYLYVYSLGHVSARTHALFGCSCTRQAARPRWAALTARALTPRLWLSFAPAARARSLRSVRLARSRSPLSGYRARGFRRRPRPRIAHVVLCSLCTTLLGRRSPLTHSTRSVGDWYRSRSWQHTQLAAALCAWIALCTQTLYRGGLRKFCIDELMTVLGICAQRAKMKNFFRTSSRSTRFPASPRLLA
jgi:hypothetical protein